MQENSPQDSFQSALIPDIIFHLDPEGRFIYISDSVKCIGYEPSELVAKHFSSILLGNESNRICRSTILPEFAGHSTGDFNSPKLFDERRKGFRMTRWLEIRIKSGSYEFVNDSKSSLQGMVFSHGIYSSMSMDSESDSGPSFEGTVGVIRNIRDNY